MTPRHVLMIAACPLPWPRGTPIRIHRMAEALVRLGHQIHVVTYPIGDASIEVNYQLHRVATSGAPPDPAPGPSFRKLAYLDPLLWARVRHLLHTRSFDLIHAHHYESLLAALLARGRRRRVPIVYDAHTLLAPELPHYGLPLPRRLVQAVGECLDRSLPRRADHVIAVSEGMQLWLASKGKVSANRMSLIPNGVEHAHFMTRTTAVPPADTLQRIVFAGNLAEYQSVQLLLEAFQRVHEAMPHVRLVLVTDTGIERLQPSLQSLGIEGLVSRVSSDYASLPARLAEADVLANPRIQCTGVPQKVLNYMAAGRPIVSFESSRGPLRDGVTALIVPEGDVAAFAAALVRLLQDPALGVALGRAARDEVVEQHGWPQVAERVTAAYEQVLART